MTAGVRALDAINPAETGFRRRPGRRDHHGERQSRLRQPDRRPDGGHPHPRPHRRRDGPALAVRAEVRARREPEAGLRGQEADAVDPARHRRGDPPGVRRGPELPGQAGSRRTGGRAAGPRSDARRRWARCCRRRSRGGSTAIGPTTSPPRSGSPTSSATGSSSTTAPRRTWSPTCWPRKDIPVLIGPLFTTRSKVELRNRSLANPGRLAAAGIEISIITDHPVVPINFLVVPGDAGGQGGPGPGDRAAGDHDQPGPGARARRPDRFARRRQGRRPGALVRRPAGRHAARAVRVGSAAGGSTTTTTTPGSAWSRRASGTASPEKRRAGPTDSAPRTSGTCSGSLAHAADPVPGRPPARPQRHRDVGREDRDERGGGEQAAQRPGAAARPATPPRPLRRRRWSRPVPIPIRQAARHDGHERRRHDEVQRPGGGQQGRQAERPGPPARPERGSDEGAERGHGSIIQGRRRRVTATARSRWSPRVPERAFAVGPRWTERGERRPATPPPTAAACRRRGRRRGRMGWVRPAGLVISTVACVAAQGAARRI